MLLPDQQELIGMLSHFYLQHGRPEKAAALLAALDLMVPDDPSTLRGLALAHLRAGNSRLALEVLDRLALQGEMDARFHLIRLQALAAEQRHEEADDARRAYLETRRQARMSSAPATPPTPAPRRQRA